MPETHDTPAFALTFPLETYPLEPEVETTAGSTRYRWRLVLSNTDHAMQGCNIVALAQGWHDTLLALKNLFPSHAGSDWLNGHPATLLWAEKMISLTGGWGAWGDIAESSERFGRAMGWLRAAQEKNGVKPIQSNSGN